MKPEKVLKDLGLIDNEVQAYLALLKFGSAPASLVGKQAKMPRSTAKFTCEQLRKKNIINSAQKGNTVIYSIHSPERLKVVLQAEKEKIDRKEAELDRVMSDLKRMMNPNVVLPKIHFYEGPEGIQQTYNHILEVIEPGDEILSFAKVNDELDAFPEIDKAAQDFIEERTKRGVKARVLAAHTKRAKQLIAADKTSLRETRIADITDFDFRLGEIIMCKDYIWSLSEEKDIFFSYVLCSPSLSKMYRALFEIAWKQAGK